MPGHVLEMTDEDDAVWCTGLGGGPLPRKVRSRTSMCVKAT